MVNFRTIAFVGLGRMGQPMARCLARAGYGVRAFDLDAGRTEALASELDAVACRSAREAASVADMAIVMLPNAAAVREAALGADGLAAGVADGMVIVDMSSSYPPATRALGAELASRRITLLDAPVSGGVRKAEDGTLAIMLGADDVAARDQAEAVLTAMGRVFRTGGLGSGHALKALNNYVSAAGLVAACEALLIGRAFGLDDEVMVNVINASTGRNNATEVKLKPFVLSGSFASGFALDLMAKDIAAAADLAADLGIDAEALQRMNDRWHEALDELEPGADHTEIFRFLERRMRAG